LYQRKFTIKFLNNLLIQFLAFLFYAVGGYLAIRGTLDLGQLVAVIAAYKELPDPIRGLIDYDQARLQVDSRYTQVIDYFASDQLQDEASQAPRAERPEPLRKGFEFTNLQVVDDTGLKLIEKATASIGLGEQVAVVGAVNSGSTHLTEALARLQKHAGGRLELNGAPLETLREAVTGRRLAYVDGGVYFPQGTIFDTLTYVLKNQPNGDLEAEDSAAKVRGRELLEARRSGNTDLDPRADWIDRDRIGAANDAALEEEIRKVLADVDMEQDVRALGLRGILDPQKQPELCDNLLVARNRFRAHLGDLGLAGIVEPFDPSAYNNQASLGENLLFGTATSPAFDPAAFSANATVRNLLEQSALDERLFAMGREVAATTIELFGDLKPDNPFFDQLDYMAAEDIPLYRAALGRIANHPMKEVSEDDRRLILKLPFAYVESKNRLDLLDDDLKARIVDARRALRAQLEAMDPCPVNFFDPDRYIPSATVIDNVLFGRVSASVAEANLKVADAIRNLLGEMQMADEIFRIGLSFNIGSGGKRLSESQRQRLQLARALLKKPDFLIVNQALNTLDSRAQKAAIDMVLAKASGRDGNRFGVIWAPMNPAFATLFPRVLVFERGVLTADGPPGQLAESSAAYRELVGA
jgi:putative ABC transport system ATP-binding protein